MSTTLIARLELRAALERAIAEDEFLLEYQPIVGLGDGRVVDYGQGFLFSAPVPTDRIQQLLET